MSKLTREQVLEIARLRIAGHSNQDICAQIPTTQSTLHYWIKRLRKEGHAIPRQSKPGRPKIPLSPSSPQTP